MKKLIWLGILAIVLIAIPVWASNVTLTANPHWNFLTDDELKGGWGMEGRLGYYIDPMTYYVFGSYDTGLMKIGGQKAGDANMFGFGLGMMADISEHISVWAQAGYYVPQFGLTGKMSANEIHAIYWHKWAAGHIPSQYNLGSAYREYEYSIKGGFGGSLGMDIHTHIWKGLSGGINTGYRFVNLEEKWTACDPFDPTQYSSYIESYEKRNMSGFTIGIKFEWKF
jgi:hypothetical protein